MSMWAVTSITHAPEGHQCQAPGCANDAVQKVAGARVVLTCLEHTLAAAQDDYRRQVLIRRWEDRGR